MSLFSSGLFGDSGSGLGQRSKDAEKTTTDATATNIVSIPLAEGQTMSIAAQITGRRTTGLSVGYTISAVFKRNSGGNVTIVGQQLNEAVHYDAGAAWTGALVADTSNQTVDVRVTGEISVTINWKCRVNYTIQSA